MELKIFKVYNSIPVTGIARRLVDTSCRNGAFVRILVKDRLAGVEVYVSILVGNC